MSWVSGIAFGRLMLLNGFKVFITDDWDTLTFLTSYIGIPIFLFFYLGHRILQGRNDPWVIQTDEVDLQSGLDETIANELSPRPRGRRYRKRRAVFE